MCWAVSISPTTYWVDNTVPCGCLPERSRTPWSSALAMASAWVSSLAWHPVSLPASPCRLNSVGHLVGSITTPCFGKDCFPPSGDLVSQRGFTGFWALNSQSHLPFSSPSAKYSPTLVACVLPWTMQRLAARGFHAVSIGEL